jgi:hypothetical protein
MTDPVPRFDVMVVCEDMNMRVAAGTGESWLRQLAVKQIIIPVDESVARSWVEVYMEAGPCAHEPFVKHAYEGEQPVFREAVIRFGNKPVRLPYGPENQEVNFFLEFRGCVFEDTLGPFKQGFLKTIGKRPTFFVREHRDLSARSRVPPGEEVIEIKKAGGNQGGLVGTRVEEL